MTCPDCGDRLQQWLDSRPRVGASAPGEPLALCPACADWAAAARRLDRGLGLLARPVPPAYLADRIVAGVAARRRVVRYRLVFAAGAAAMAAAVMLVVWQSFFHRAAPAPAPNSAPVAAAPNREPAPPAEHVTLRDSVEAAGSAAASLASRTAGETVEKTKMLLPAVDPSMGRFDLPPSLDPPAQSLRAAGGGVAAGLEPVADSARRAVGLFLRELPPMEPTMKGGL